MKDPQTIALISVRMLRNEQVTLGLARTMNYASGQYPVYNGNFKDLNSRIELLHAIGRTLCLKD